MIESARAADAARLAADMESERAKLSELQANHLVFSRELAATRSQEVSQKRELMNFQDELDSIKKKHAREIADLEADYGRGIGRCRIWRRTFDSPLKTFHARGAIPRSSRPPYPNSRLPTSP
jgi:hypothetical protein